jgi:threonine/homoserine/homoserine lactone efflux protein
MIDAYLNLLIFIILMVGTPGPANLLVMIGGARHGVGKCSGFIFGLIGGKLVLNIGFGIGLGLFLTSQPLLLQILKFASAGYMIWLAVQSWNSVGGGDADRHQFHFRQGVIVHPLNPKAWVMVLLAWTQFAPELGDGMIQLLLVPVTFAAVQLVCHTAWCAAGAFMQRAIPQQQLLTRALILLTIGVVVWALLQ